MSLITVTLPDGSRREVESNDAVVTHAADADGRYIGLVLMTLGEPEPVRVPCQPPAGDGWRWDGATWRRDVPMAETVAAALQAVDQAAGAARLRYITDVAGQQATYLLKAEQAAAYLANPAGVVPPYVQAEAEATGREPLAVAQSIARTGLAWADDVGPMIERERMRGKFTVRAATNAPDVLAAEAKALAVLAGI